MPSKAELLKARQAALKAAAEARRKADQQADDLARGFNRRGAPTTVAGLDQLLDRGLRRHQQQALSLIGEATGEVLAQTQEVLGRRVRSREVLAELKAIRGGTVTQAVARHHAQARRAGRQFIRQQLKAGATPTQVQRQLAQLLRGDARAPRGVGGLSSLRTDVRRLAVSESYNTMRATVTAALKTQTKAGMIRVGRWATSPSHGRRDRCDDLAQARLGYGPGWHPLARWPKAPHPHCACYLAETRWVKRR